MGLLGFLFGNNDSSQEDLDVAETYLREQSSDGIITPLVRHYAIEEVTDDIERRAGVSLRDSETAEIVQKLRNQYDMGPIDEWNMPGYVDADDYPEDQEERRTQIAEREQSGGGFIGWLFGR